MLRATFKPAMTPDLQKEFHALQETAMKMLGDIPMSGGYRHVYSLWVDPSFEPPYCWTFYTPLPNAKDKDAFASFLIWRRDLDSEKLRSPTERLRYPTPLLPTIESDTVPLTDSEIQTFQDRIRGISVPIYVGPPKFVGCDGTGYRFRCDEMFYGAAVHWWEDQPVEWLPFTKVVQEIVTELNIRREGSIAGTQASLRSE